MGKEEYSTSDRENDLKIFREKLESCCSIGLDPRVLDNQHYEFHSIIGIILCAIIAGANTISDICDYAELQYEWLSKWLSLPESPPKYGVFWWMLVRLDPVHTESIFRNWIKSLSPSQLKGIIAIDGKRVKGASKKKTSKGILHMVSAWSSSQGMR